MSDDGAQGLPPGEQLARWRQLGAEGRAPWQFHLIEALARRAMTHSGRLRQVLDERLAELIAAYPAAPGLESAPGGVAGRGPEAGSVPAGPLAALAQRLNQPWSETGGGDPVPSAGGPAGAAARASAPVAEPPELRSLQRFRSTWSQLGTAQRLRQSLAQVPQQAGPLNSQLLVLRALQQMQASSPAYLAHFIAQAEALLWLEQAGLQAATPAARGARGEADKRRKPGRAKGG